MEEASSGHGVSNEANEAGVTLVAQGPVNVMGQAVPP